MKNLLKLCLPALVIFAVSCKKDPIAGLPGTPSANDPSFDKVEFIDENMVLNPEVAEATEDQPLAILNDGMGEDPSVTLHGHRPLPLCFKACLRSLALDSNQKHALHRALMELDSCRLPLIREIRKIDSAIIHQANLRRIQLISDFRSGKITKPQLVRALHELHKHVRHTLKNDPQRQALIKQLAECYRQFRMRLGQILTPPQKKAFARCMHHC